MEENTAVWRGSGVGHAKAILLGEHAVVHGHPAIACALPLHTTASVTVRPHQREPLAVCSALSGLARTAAQAVVQRLLTPGYECTLNVLGTVPMCAGLGSSAALCAAIARAVQDAMRASGCQAVPDSQALFDAAMAGERVFHGSPSGIDACCALFGGAVVAVPRDTDASFGRPLVSTDRHAFVHIPHCTLSLAVISTRTTKDSTRSMIARASNPAAIAAIGNHTRQAIQAINETVQKRNETPTTHADDRPSNAVVDLGTHIQAHVRPCQEQLAALGVSTPAIDRLVKHLSDRGMYAKLTGAGGGGCVVAIGRRCIDVAVTPDSEIVYAGTRQYE